MKKLFYTIAFTLVTSIIISSCSEENIKPRDGGGSQSSDQCQFGCK